MPNHVFNHIEASKGILDSITSLDEMNNVEFDFNNIIPMPDYVYSDGSLGQE